MMKEKSAEAFSLSDEVKGVIEVLLYKANSAKVKIIFEPLATGEVVGDPAKWSQVVLNLITNAIDAYDTLSFDSNRERKIVIKLEEFPHAFAFSVTDFGSGIKEEDLPKIFDPFFSTKKGDSTKGTGIGLSMAKRIIEKDFDGTVEVDSKLNKGTVFTVTLKKQSN
jgi:signal transduction histidine kinase